MGFERDHPRDVQRLDRVAVHLVEQQQHQGAVAAYELGDLPEVGPPRRLAQQHYRGPSIERYQQDAEVAIPLGAPQHARRGVLPWRCFQELERLSMIYNRNMTGLFPQGLQELPALRRLEMHDTHLRGNVPAGPWTSLQLLLISGTGGLC